MTTANQPPRTQSADPLAELITEFLALYVLRPLRERAADELAVIAGEAMREGVRMRAELEANRA